MSRTAPLRKSIDPRTFRSHGCHKGIIRPHTHISLSFTPTVNRLRPASSSASSTMLHSTPLKAVLLHDHIDLALASTSAPPQPRMTTSVDRNDSASLHLPSPAPISSLPAELLIEVFVFSSIIDPLSPLTIRVVSRRWRETVDTSPQVWRHISLDDDESRSITLQNYQAERWARLSSPLQFDVEVNAANLDNMLPLISPLLPYIDRWRSFTLTGQREDEVDMSELDLNVATFHHLNISICDWDTEYLEEDEVKSTFVSSYPPFAYMMNVWVGKLPSYEMTAPLRFTTVHITEGSFGAVSAHPRSVLDFLRACPDLQCFYFSGWPHDEDLSSERLPVVNLPNLHTLQFKSTCSARAYLSCLYTPLLQNLHLAHLNVDFKLQGEYNEPGDSEDEAGDYSQSPSSDQATGMGLRKLIQRSHPPLKVLEMDFSDMRTKDFRYIFDRVADLEEFRIVASDMSDKVIRLLKPSFFEDGTAQLRLPHLRIFRLYNCQRLSGNAIVSALASRLTYTDNKLESDSLSEVAIVGCDGFTSAHEVQLERILRSRLRYD